MSDSANLQSVQLRPLLLSEQARSSALSLRAHAAGLDRQGYYKDADECRRHAHTLSLCASALEHTDA